MSVHYRKYANYIRYVNHQKLNLQCNLQRFQNLFWTRYERIFKRIKAGIQPLDKINGPVICLGSRLGEEVKAFRNLGFEAVGIDLYPGVDNPYVIQGDFHNIQFDDNEFGTIYTNAIDHAFNLDKVSNECYRVLQDGGILFLDITTSAKHIGKEQLLRDVCESMVWDSIEDVVEIFKRQGFVELCRSMESSDCDGKPFLGIIFQLDKGKNDASE